MKLPYPVLPVLLLVIVTWATSVDPGLLAETGQSDRIAAALVSSMRDMEIRSQYDERSKRSEVTLALHPSAPHGTGLLLLVAEFEGRTPQKTPKLSVSAYLGVACPMFCTSGNESLHHG